MIFETHILQKPLADFIESIFYFKGFSPEHTIERVVPTGHLFALFELDGIPRQTFDNTSLEPIATFQEAWISGMHKHHLSISAAPDSEMLVVQFKPYGAYPFLHIPISALNDRVIPIKEILGNEALEMRTSLISEATVAGKFKIVEEYLLGRFDSKKSPEKDLIDIVRQMQIKPVDNHSNIIEAYSKTQKQLIAKFKKYVGLTPKVLHRILRFNSILGHIQNKEKIKWSEIAYEFGYTDQSHFIKEFRFFSGFNPQEFIDADLQHAQPNFFPLDGKG